MSEDQTVYLGRKNGNHTGIYHTDPDCQNLQLSERERGPRTPTLDQLNDTWRECKVCKNGGPLPADNDGPELSAKLAKMDPDEVSAP